MIQLYEQFDGIQSENLEKKDNLWEKYKLSKLTQEQMFK